MPATMQLSADKWIRFLNAPTSPRLRVFCLPFAGGGTLQYRPWARVLPADVQLCGLVLPGREERMNEPALTQMSSLVNALVAALRPHLDLPFVLYGHSMGGLVGYELAHALRERLGVSPAHLIVSARVAPDVPVQSALSTLPDAQFVTALNQRYGGIPQILLDEPELLALFIPVMRADLTVVDTYRYQPRELLSCPISAFGGTTDQAVAPAALEAWSRHTRGPFTMQLVDGGHFFIQTNQARWLTLLSNELRNIP